MPEPVVAPKDPILAEHGRRGARRRWAGHPPARVVRLDALSPEQRSLVLALIDAAKVAEREKAAAARTAAASAEGTTDAAPTE